MTRREKKWVIAPARFLRQEELQRLRKCAKSRATEEKQKSCRVVECVVLEVALGSGLRVAEIAGLDCGDLSLGLSSGTILVRQGKGGKRRTVIISGRLCRVLENFLRWKGARGEIVSSGSPLIASPQTAAQISTRALQKMFGRLLVASGIGHHRFHDLRHTYGSYLLRASGNDLVFVRNQMGHSDLTTTAVYLHALNAEKAVNALYR